MRRVMRELLKDWECGLWLLIDALVIAGIYVLCSRF